MSRSYNIAIEQNGTTYSILNLGFDKYGGYFISDLSSERKKYLITIAKLKLGKHGAGRGEVDRKTQWITHNKPKLMHHVDGVSHVSGFGIRSGFFKTIKKAKGVATRRYSNFNDGGPVFTFVFWGLQKFSCEDKNADIIFSQRHITITPRNLLPPCESNAYVLEGYYLPKSVITQVDLSDGTIKFNHPNFGIIPLKYIPCPEKCPGIIAVGCHTSRHGFDSDHGFTCGGGVTTRNSDGMNRTIFIIYPFESSTRFKRRYSLKSLDFGLFDRLKCWLDDQIFSILNNLKRFFWGA